MRSRHLSSSTLVAMLVAAAPMLMAQGVSTQLSGKVTDAKGSAVAGATVIVVEAVLLPGFESVEDEDSETVAAFVTWVPAEAVTLAAMLSVAVELALMSPIVHVPVEEA